MTAQEADEQRDLDREAESQAQEVARSLSWGAILVAMADEQRDIATAAAERAGETEAWTEKWRTQSALAPALKSEGWFEERAVIAETYREESDIARRRQGALEAGARALGVILPD